MQTIITQRQRQIIKNVLPNNYYTKTNDQKSIKSILPSDYYTTVNMENIWNMKIRGKFYYVYMHYCKSNKWL